MPISIVPVRIRDRVRINEERLRAVEVTSTGALRTIEMPPSVGEDDSIATSKGWTVSRPWP